MNQQSAALLEILARCNPEDAELRKESDLQAILQSDAYAELKARKVFHSYFEQSFSAEKLRNCSDKELAAAKSAIPLIPTVLEELIYSLKNGGAPLLQPSDRPDFLDPASLRSVIGKLHDTGGKNYTNISAGDFMAIFEPDTVKSLGNRFLDLPSYCDDFSGALGELYQGKKYCVSAAELETREADYQAKLSELNETIDRAKSKRKWRTFIKAEIALIALFVPTIVSGLTGGIAPTLLTACTVAELLLAVVFLIWG